MKKIYIILLGFILLSGSVFAQCDPPSNVRIKIKIVDVYTPNIMMIWDVDSTAIDHKFFLDEMEVLADEGWSYFPSAGMMYIGGSYNEFVTLDSYHDVGICAVDNQGSISDTVWWHFYFSETAYARPEITDFQFENNYEEESTLFTWSTPPYGGGPDQPTAVGYDVYLDGDFVANATDLQYTFAGLSRGSNYAVGLTTYYSDGFSDTTFFPNYSRHEFYFDTLACPSNLTVNESNGTIYWGQPFVDADNNMVGGTYIGLPIGIMFPMIWIIPDEMYTTFGDNDHFVYTAWDIWIWLHNSLSEDKEGLYFANYGMPSINYAQSEARNISEISNAGSLSYLPSVTALDATTNGGIGAFVPHFNSAEGYYGVMRVDDIYDWDGEEGKVDFTWWVNKQGEGDFSEAYNYYPESYNIYLNDEFVDNIIPEFDGYEYRFDYDYQFENLILGQYYTAGVEAVYRVGNSESEMVTIDFISVGINENHENSSLQAVVFPNPVSSNATISYSITEAGPVTVEIYNTMGQKIKTLVDKEIATGEHQTTWNRLDDRGNPVAGGFYFCTLKAANQTQILKMTVY